MELRGKTSQQMIKDANLKLIFNLISQFDPISRIELKKMTGLSATTVSTLCEELRQKDLIVETGIKESNTSGRKAVLMSINPNGGYFCGIELSSILRLDCYDLNFRRFAGQELEISDWSSLSDLIFSALKKIQHASEKHGSLLGMTIGAPASIDVQNNRIIASTVLENLKPDEDIVGDLKKRLPDVPVLLCNNSSLIAYAEKEFGSHACNLVSIDISEGVGSGIVIDGSIYTGASGFAGEFGHVSIDRNGPRCKCGSYGCLESMVNVPAILKKIEEKTGQKMTLEAAQKTCEKGNAAISEILTETARLLSFGINNLLNLLNPEVIIISGAITAFGDGLLEPLSRFLAEKALPGKQIPIQFTSVKGNPITLGGARYAFDVRFQ